MSKGSEKDEGTIGGGPAGAYRQAHHKEDPGAEALKARKQKISQEIDKYESARHAERLKSYKKQ